MGSKFFKPRPLAYLKDGSWKKLMVIVKNDRYEDDHARPVIRSGVKAHPLPVHLLPDYDWSRRRCGTALWGFAQELRRKLITQREGG